MFQTFTSNRSNVALILITQIAAFWAVLSWQIGRVWSSSEESYSMFAIVVLIFLCVIKRKDIAPKSISLVLPTIFVTFYAVSFAFAPPIVRAILAVTAICFVVSRYIFNEFFNIAVYALMLLALPLVASLNFFLGFPLRVIVGESVEFLLRLQGLNVVREGVALHFGEKLIWIDAPCSGIKMLWFGLFLAAVLTTLRELDFFKTVMAFAVAFAAILIGNVFRASALFYTEAEILPFDVPAWTHEAVGVWAFILTALAIVFSIEIVHRKTIFADGDERLSLMLSKYKANLRQFPSVKSLSIICFTIACAAACVAPFLVVTKKVESASQNFTGFPKTFEGVALEQLELTARETIFLEDFPGKVGRFTDGRREIILRYVSEPTRKLHPAADCFRGIGYAVEPLPLKVNENNERFACFRATKSQQNLQICERIFSETGESWTDVSAWYWSALSQSEGAWWAVTTAENLPD